MATATSRKAPRKKPPGRQQKAEAKRRAQLAKMRARSGSRWRVHYDIDGPRVRLGILWFVLTVIALAVGPVLTALHFAVASAAAAAHALRTWRARGVDVDPRVALGATAVVVACAGVGPELMGVAVLAVTAAIVAVAAVSGDATATMARAGTILQVTLPAAVAGGCVVLLASREVWAAVALVLLVSAYETGDYLVGSGAANSVEGPAAGTAAVFVMSMAVAAAGVPPFAVAEAMLLGVAVAPLAFLGQLLASGMLPHARAFAPALRRVDSLLLAAPLWYVVVTRIVL